MAKRRLKLTAYSHTPGAEGDIGQIIECDDKQAEYLLHHGAAEELEPATRKPPVEASPQLEPPPLPEDNSDDTAPYEVPRGNPKRARS